MPNTVYFKKDTDELESNQRGKNLKAITENSLNEWVISCLEGKRTRRSTSFLFKYLEDHDADEGLVETSQIQTRTKWALLIYSRKQELFLFMWPNTKNMRLSIWNHRFNNYLGRMSYMSATRGEI